jgi:hypothetical protein
MHSNSPPLFISILGALLSWIQSAYLGRFIERPEQVHSKSFLSKSLIVVGIVTAIFTFTFSHFIFIVDNLLSFTQFFQYILIDHGLMRQNVVYEKCQHERIENFHSILPNLTMLTILLYHSVSDPIVWHWKNESPKSMEGCNGRSFVLQNSPITIVIATFRIKNDRSRYLPNDLLPSQSKLQISVRSFRTWCP